MTSSPAPLDRLLAVLESPALAGDLATQPDLWEEIKRLAEIHRFSGLLAHSASPWLPPSERPWRDQVLMAHHRRHEQRLVALRRLTEAFREEGLACVSLKGPLLAERFYTHPFLRSSNDIDLLIRERDTGASARLMNKMGFQLEAHYPWHLQRHVIHHLNFGTRDRSPRVEVHYHLWNGAGSVASDEFLDRAITWQSATGFESLVLAGADEAFYSCVHAALHAFHRLRWLYDAIAIARSLTPEEHARVRHLAVRHAQTGRFAAAAMAVQEFFGEPLPLDCADFPVPWLWNRLTPLHTRRMVQRVEGNTSTFREKIGFRLDLCRMTGSPLAAARLFAYFADCEIRKRWYEFRHSPIDPGVLARTLPD